MKEYDRVMLINDKKRYQEHGVQKGMDGWICDPRNIDGYWLVCFDQEYDKPNIATIAVKEVDLIVTREAYVIKQYDKVMLLDDEGYGNGLRIGSRGWICGAEEVDKSWLVCFDEDGTVSNAPKVLIKTDDLSWTAKYLGPDNYENRE